MVKTKVLVAMSGGVDSSVVASRLLDEGYDVEGATLDFGRFCSENAVKDAGSVANQLGIKHHIIKCENNFETNVIKYFVNDYISGKTPNPCVKCNRELKFAELLKARENFGADYLATGHYAKIENINGNYYLKKANDLKKDQSYFLSQLKYEYLQYIKFPLESITKDEVREYARRLQLAVADKQDSQDVCFTKGKDYKAIIENYYIPKSGDIVHINGKKIGIHNGIINYTQGQRKGLGIGGYSEPLFVLSIDAEKNIVYVGSEKDLFKSELTVSNLNFLVSGVEYNKKYEFDVKLRSTNSPVKADVIFHESSAQVKLLEPSRNVSKGQVCCFYDNDLVIGSGYIE